MSDKSNPSADIASDYDRLASDDDGIASDYDRLASDYDRLAKRMQWFGFRDSHYHRQAVDALAIQPGDRVVVVGIGTGVDVARIERAGGSVIGVDASAGMLAQVAPHVQTHLADAAQWQFPACERILCSYTLLFQDYDATLERAWEALTPGGVLVATDLQVGPALIPLVLPFVKKFGHSSATLLGRPMEYMTKWPVLKDQSYYFGLGRLVAVCKPKDAVDTLA